MREDAVTLMAILCRPDCIPKGKMPLTGVRFVAALVLAVPWLAAASDSQGAIGAQPAGDAAKDRVGATERWTDHLKLTTYPGTPTASPGDRVSLIVEIEPGARMHVYAPGADGYRLVTLKVVDQEFVRLVPIKYPPSEIYVFEPLNERIPVYQKPFKLIQELILGTGPQAEAVFRASPELTLKGTLEYQACDDRICFNPVSVPLSWTVALRPGASRESGPTPAPK